MDSNPIPPLAGGPAPLRPNRRERRRREQRPFTLPRPDVDASTGEDPTTLEPQPRRRDPAASDVAVSHLRAEDEAGRHIDVRG